MSPRGGGRPAASACLQPACQRAGAASAEKSRRRCLINGGFFCAFDRKVVDLIEGDDTICCGLWSSWLPT
jgi:hypothetical protein